MKKAAQGGQRQGSGRKKKYAEVTTTVAFRVPVSKVSEIKSIVSEALKKMYLSS